jgi:hypothetical protein
MRIRSTVSANLSGVAEKPGATTRMTRGAPSTPRAATTMSTTNRKVATRLMSRWVSASPRWLRYSARMGTKAWEKAPSANRRRSRLGSLKATTKASVATPAPNTRAMMASRAKPRMRDSKVMELTAARARRRFMGSDGGAEKTRHGSEWRTPGIAVSPGSTGAIEPPPGWPSRSWDGPANDLSANDSKTCLAGFASV